MSFESAGYQLLPVLPELVLAAGAMVLLMLGAYRGPQTTSLVTGLAVCLLVLVGVLELLLPAGKLTTFSGSFIVDDFARFLKILTLIGSAATLILSAEFLADPSRRIFEYSILVLLSTLGMMVLISAGDLIMLYLGLELMSLALYVVAASNRDNAKSTEAGLKYFVLGALSSGMLLYGASLVYGFTGTVSFAGIAAAAKTGSVGIVFGLVFLLAGLCFKVSAVPFHMWTPDVYEGAPTPVTAFFASAPKVAALAVFTRVALTAFPDIVSQWPPTELAEGYNYEAVQENYVITDNQRILRVYYVQPLQHVAGMLMAYLPAERIAFEADLFDTHEAPKPAQIPSMRSFYNQVQRMKLDVTTLAPIHGKPVPWNNFVTAFNSMGKTN